jgi:predicted nucleic acid-binding Zn ribbon protein
VGLRRAGARETAARLFDTPERALALVRAAWPGAVGAEIARRTEVVGLAGGTLLVRVPDGRWRRTLHRLQRVILRRLGEVAGERAPARLGFTEGPVPEREPAPSPGAAAEPAPLPAAIVESARTIPDPEIRVAFERSAALYLERRRRARRPGPEP